MIKTFPTNLLDIEQLPYEDGLALMRGLVDVRHLNGGPEVLILLEHEPVFTMGRQSQTTDILVSSDDLEKKGIAVHRVERGGLITYHGPGQLVAYPIFHLRQMGLGVADMVHQLEEVILQTLSRFGITGWRKEGYRGVWVETDKIASIGIAVRRGITFHGLALNYDTDLAHFDLINPCGLSGVRMTSMAKILGSAIDPVKLRQAMSEYFKKLFFLDYSEWSLAEAREFIATGS
ncbi:MAG: lipoyl(octanoyl) transferase LipB [Deltaproteobacteria bacterium]|nr:lipoyl(octanoyl) transferase LipB [Deltaproteobacteria bacterium]